MKKWLIIGASAAIIVAVVIVLGLSNLGPIIKTAVNTKGPDMTRTQVALSDVEVGLFSAEATLKGLLLGNPKGFTSPQAMKVDTIHVNLDETSLTSDTIVIDSIEVVRPDITYERRGGTDNFQTILANVRQSIGSKASPEEPESTSGRGSAPEDKGKKLLIRNFIVKDGKVNLAMAFLGGKPIGASLPDIHLKDIGKEEGGASAAEALKQVLAALYKEITSPSVTKVFSNGLKEVGSSLGSIGSEAKKAGKDAVKDLGDVGEKLKGLFGK